MNPHHLYPRRIEKNLDIGAFEIPYFLQYAKRTGVKNRGRIGGDPRRSGLHKPISHNAIIL